MKNMVCAAALLVTLAVILVSCAGPYAASRREVFEGRQLLNRGEYAEAQQAFVKAIAARPSAWAYALAATASYKMNDLPDAQRYIDEAFKMDGTSDAYLRMLAYRALILLKEGRQQEGTQALRHYLDSYKNYYPIPHRGEIERILAGGGGDLARLERLLDEGIDSYESDVAQREGEGTGYMANRYGRPVFPTVP